MPSETVRSSSNWRQQIEGVLVVLLNTDLTHRAMDDARKSSDPLQRSESMVGALLESAAQAILAVNEDGRCVLANRMAEKMFGYEQEELLGQQLDLLVPTDARHRHREHHKAFFADPRSRPMGIGLDLQGQRKDGSRFPIEVSLNTIETLEGRLGVAFVSDITERKRVEEALHQSEERLRLAVDSTGLGTFDFDPRTGKLIWSDVSKSYFGLPPDAEVDDATFRKGIHPEDRDRVQRIVEEAMRPESRGQYATEYRTIGINDGKERWISAWGRVLFDRLGQPERFIGVMLDISEKKRLEKAVEASRNEIRALAASLLTAQEEERRRMSRELHDQVCQQLASLAIDIGGLAAERAAEDAQHSLKLKALQARIVKASEETRHIAYELHPSVLDDLGLVASLRALCKEFSEQANNMAVEFTDIAVPSSISREVASCLYRVAHESLQNTAKHAGAKHVSAALTLQKGTLVLTIADDGIGFDPEIVKGRGGLGLISMEERARLVNGKLSIAAQPGHGTRITVEVPLPAGSS